MNTLFEIWWTRQCVHGFLKLSFVHGTNETRNIQETYGQFSSYTQVVTHTA